MDNLSIICATTFESSHYEAVNQLLSQLTSRSIVFTEDDYRQLIEAPHSHLFLLFHGGSIVGMLTVGIYYSPTGGKAWIEDVVVDESFRGQGLSKLLVAHAIKFVKEKQIPSLMLTSNPRRVTANKLYQTMGFGKKETNVYRIKF